jgi:hypothetical protein
MCIGYISAHHENLMGGMQDVALLASRYNNLSENAKKVKKNINHFKQEVHFLLETHNVLSINNLSAGFRLS